MANRIPRAVLFDRDGTLIRDVPYNGDPSLVEPMPTAAEALAELRARGIRIGVVTNQSGIARGLLSSEEVDAVNARVDRLLGPFDVWRVCPHGVDDGCTCRKPAPGMLRAACEALAISPEEAVMIGDIGADMAAATAAGMRGVLVPTAVTRPHEIAAAAHVASDVMAAVRLVLAEGGADAAA
ncbi:D-glycero-alpha-D-manno-heptose-1,7-bisphosphate 7-phosphatase [Agromyces indicus]|uniref:D,D-heptose 1,7-bisphosphate phosphatase n=1 Tax=Agromyces indicus TaxID=758919 RepID=A0ABU1FK60_9MICO|nr:HAD family hydrolase [Agromyces indicus]MDR5692142.1 HAD family hydrolase [Agromyces indicus]